ncbi:S-layer homology domain-containing protein, partial [Bacillus wiedmannii]
NSVRSLYSNGITNGIGNYQYGGKLNVTREQFAKFMYSAINVSPYFVPDSIPAKDEDKYKEIENILIDSGFLKTDYNYVFTKTGQTYDGIMYFNFSPYDDSAYRMSIHRDDPVLNEPVKKILNTLLPTKADYLYSLIKNPTASSRTIELDGRKIEFRRDSSTSISVYLGKRKY